MRSRLQLQLVARHTSHVSQLTAIIITEAKEFYGVQARKKQKTVLSSNLLCQMARAFVLAFDSDEPYTAAGMVGPSAVIRTFSPNVRSHC